MVNLVYTYLTEGKEFEYDKNLKPSDGTIYLPYLVGWYYTTVLGQHRRECHLFRDHEPSLCDLITREVIHVNSYKFTIWCN